jgi:hypothetical protein
MCKSSHLLSFLCSITAAWFNRSVGFNGFYLSSNFIFNGAVYASKTNRWLMKINVSAGAFLLGLPTRG